MLHQFSRKRLLNAACLFFPAGAYSWRVVCWTPSCEDSYPQVCKLIPHFQEYNFDKSFTEIPLFSQPEQQQLIHVLSFKVALLLGMKVRFRFQTAGGKNQPENWWPRFFLIEFHPQKGHTVDD